MSENRTVITAEQFKAKALREVDIQGFEAGEKITIRIRSLSLMKLVTTGRIPNALMATALELFEGKKKASAEELADTFAQTDKLTNMAGLIDVICENAMVEPSYAEVGEYLTDDQKMEIFQYTQGGVKDLSSFRTEPSDK